MGASDSLAKILADPQAHTNRVIVPAGMYHIERSRSEQLGGPRKYAASEQTIEPGRINSHPSIDLEVEPKLVEHLDRLAPQQSRGKVAILTVWVANSGECGLVKVDILQAAHPRLMSGYKHKPDINYEVLEVTPEGSRDVKAEDEQWEKPERLLALAHSYKTRVKADQKLWYNLKDNQILVRLNNLWAAAVRDILRGQQRQMLGR